MDLVKSFSTSIWLRNFAPIQPVPSVFEDLIRYPRHATPRRERASQSFPKISQKLGKKVRMLSKVSKHRKPRRKPRRKSQRRVNRRPKKRPQKSRSPFSGRRLRQRGPRRRSRRCPASLAGPTTFTGLVLGCIEAKFCKKICVGKLSTKKESFLWRGKIRQFELSGI